MEELGVEGRGGVEGLGVRLSLMALAVEELEAEESKSRDPELERKEELEGMGEKLGLPFGILGVGAVDGDCLEQSQHHSLILSTVETYVSLVPTTGG